MANYNNSKEHAYMTFTKDIGKEVFPSVLLLYGQEDYLIDWAVSTVVKKFVNPDMKSFDFVKLEDDANMEDIVDSCETISLLSSKRVVWANNYLHLRKKQGKGFTEEGFNVLKDYIKNPNDATILIFSSSETDLDCKLSKYLKTNSAHYEFGPLDKSQLKSFALKRISEENMKIQKDTLDYLIEQTGYRNRESQYTLLNLFQDIKKISAYSENGIIKEEDIDATLFGDLDKYAFDFIEKISYKKRKEALEIYNNMMNYGGDFYKTLGLLVNQYELMLVSKELMSKGLDYRLIAKELKMNEFRIKKACETAAKYKLTSIKSILIKLYELDRKVKTGQMEANLSMELFIATI